LKTSGVIVTLLLLSVSAAIISLETLSQPYTITSTATILETRTRTDKIPLMERVTATSTLTEHGTYTLLGGQWQSILIIPPYATYIDVVGVRTRCHWEVEPVEANGGDELTGILTAKSKVSLYIITDDQYDRWMQSWVGYAEKKRPEPPCSPESLYKAEDVTYLSIHFAFPSNGLYHLVFINKSLDEVVLTLNQGAGLELLYETTTTAFSRRLSSYTAERVETKFQVQSAGEAFLVPSNLGLVTIGLVGGLALVIVFFAVQKVMTRSRSRTHHTKGKKSRTKSN